MFSTEFDKIIRKHNNRLQKHKDTINTQSLVLNDQPPFWDNDNKPHAPNDGYLWDNIQYSKGEYLKVKENIPKDEYICNLPSSIIVPDELYQVLKNNEHVSVLSIGKQWTIAGKTVKAIVFHKTKKAFLNLIIQYSKSIINSYKNKTDKKATLGNKIITTGIVKDIKVSYARSKPIYKMLVELDDGTTTYGTLPNQSIKVNDRIKFQATFTQSDSTSHSYFKYPVLK